MLITWVWGNPKGDLPGWDWQLMKEILGSSWREPVSCWLWRTTLLYVLYPQRHEFCPKSHHLGRESQASDENPVPANTTIAILWDWAMDPDESFPDP